MKAAPYFDDEHTQRTGAGVFVNSYAFSMPSGHSSAEHVTEKSEVVFIDQFAELCVFTVQTASIESTRDGSILRVFAEDAVQDELLGLVVLPVSHVDNTALQLLTAALSGSRITAGVVEAPSASVYSFDWLDYPTAWQCVLDVAEAFNLEIATRYVSSGGFVTERYVDLVTQRGEYSGRTIDYERDTESVTRSGDGGELYTAVYGLGATVDGDTLTFADSVWAVSSGDPVDKPEGQTYVAIASARDVYGLLQTDGSRTHRFGVFRDSGEVVSGTLLTKAYAFLEEHIVPQYTYDVSLAALERYPAQSPSGANLLRSTVGIGDTVVVSDSACYPAYRTAARVIEIRRSYSDPALDRLVLGRPRKRLADFMRDITLLKRALNR